MDIVVTDSDREQAKVAMCDGWHKCRATNNIGQIGKPCDCDIGAIDGCKARVEAVALAIATARKI